MDSSTTHRCIRWTLARAIALMLVAATPLAQTYGQSDRDLSREDVTLFEKHLEQLHEEKKFNGTVLIAKDGEIVFEESVGIANPEDETPLSERSSFRLASVSKQFTAMCIMMLAEDGKLDYDDDIRKHLPELPYEGITIRHLLHHTGGLPDYMMLFGQHWETEKRANERSMAFNQDTVRLFAEHRPERNFAPGEKWEYNNTGYVLLGQIITEASGMPVHEFMQKRIFDPLEMSDSRAFVGEDFQLYERVYGFRFKQRGGYRNNDHHYLNGMVGDGGVYCSARDLLKWDQALYTDKLVSQDTLNQAFTSGKLNDGKETGYGFGWGVKRNDGGIQVSHGGGWVGFRTFIGRDIENRRLVVILSNCSTSVLQTVIQKVAEIKH